MDDDDEGGGPAQGAPGDALPVWLMDLLRSGGPIRSPSAKSRQWRCRRPWPGLSGGVSTPTLVGNGIFPSGTSVGSAAQRRAKRSKWSSESRTRSESEGSENDHEEQTADRIAEELGLTQFLRRRNKKRGGRGRDRGHSKSEAAPKRGGGGGRQVSSLRRWCHGAAVLRIGRPPL